MERMTEESKGNPAVRFLGALSPRTVGGALTLAAILSALAVGTLVWHDYRVRQREMETLRMMVARLESERRVAQIFIESQHRDAADGVLVTELRFAEVDERGMPPEEKRIRVRGEEVYFDALVIKFERDFVKQGDPLRGRSLYLFRRVFGSSERPEDGAPLDEACRDGIPAAYRTSKRATAFEKRLWERFWDLASDADAAAREGVRVAQVEAVGMRPRPGQRYSLVLEQASGLNLKPMSAGDRK